MVFPQPWLNEKSIDHPDLTNREVQAAVSIHCLFWFDTTLLNNAPPGPATSI